MDDRDRHDTARNGEIPWRVADLERRCLSLEKAIDDLREKQQDLRTRAQVFGWLVPVAISIAILLKAWISG